MAVKFIEIDLKRAVEPLSIPEEAKELWILAFWGEQPLGWMRLDLQADKRDRQYRLMDLSLLKKSMARTFGWDLWRQAVSGNLVNNCSDQHLFPISVVVCTRDRRISLER